MDLFLQYYAVYENEFLPSTDTSETGTWDNSVSNWIGHANPNKMTSSELTMSSIKLVSNSVEIMSKMYSRDVSINPTHPGNYSDLLMSSDIKKTVAILQILRKLCPYSSNGESSTKCKWHVLESVNKMVVTGKNNIAYAVATVVHDGTQVAASESLAAKLGGGAIGARNSANCEAQSDDDEKKFATVVQVMYGPQNIFSIYDNTQPFVAYSAQESLHKKSTNLTAHGVSVAAALDARVILDSLHKNAEHLPRIAQNVDGNYVQNDNHNLPGGTEQIDTTVGPSEKSKKLPLSLVTAFRQDGITQVFVDSNSKTTQSTNVKEIDIIRMAQTVLLFIFTSMCFFWRANW